jgi:hypothetical protein
MVLKKERERLEEDKDGLMEELECNGEEVNGQEVKREDQQQARTTMVRSQ